MTPPEGAGQVVSHANGLLVVAGTHTIAVDRAGHARVLLHVETAFKVAVAAIGVVFIATAQGGATTLYRWDLALGSVDSLCEVPQKCEHLATDRDAATVALDWHGCVAVCDGVTGAVRWTRDAGDLYFVDDLDDPDDPDDRRELDEPTKEIAIEDDAVVLYKYREDRDDPGDETYAIARIRAAGAIETKHEYGNGRRPAWYAPPSDALGGRRSMSRDHEFILTIAPDGSRVATPAQAWTVPEAAFVDVKGLDSWYSSWWLGSAGTYTPTSLAYNAHYELLRISTGHGQWILETCHGSAARVSLPDSAIHGAVLPGSGRVVVATPDRVTLDDLVLVAEGPATGLACADDGSAIAVGLDGHVLIFDGAGTPIAKRALPSATGLAVACGGIAVACIDRGRLAIAHATGIVHSPIDARVRGQPIAFSPDGTLVAYATTSWGYAIVDAATGALRIARRDLPSPVNAIAFAPDGRTLFTLGAYGRIVQWELALS